MMETPEQFGIKDSERTRCEIWTRVMGYHRPISSFNIGKQGEAAERRYFSEKKCYREFQVRQKEKQIWYTEWEKASIIRAKRTSHSSGLLVYLQQVRSFFIRRMKIHFNKPPLPVEEQVKLLQSRGLIVPDSQRASRYLLSIGYYRFSAYCIPFEYCREGGDSSV